MILDDVCRCHDDGCAKRYACARWVHRDTGSPHAPHSWSLYPIPEDDDTPAPLSSEYAVPCPYLIEAAHG